MTQFVCFWFIGSVISIVPLLFEVICPTISPRISLSNTKMAWKKQSYRTDDYKSSFIKVLLYILFSVILIITISVNLNFTGKNEPNSESDLFAFGTMLPSSLAPLAFKTVCPEQPQELFPGVMRGYVYSETQNYSICYEVCKKTNDNDLKYLLIAFSDLRTFHVQMPSTMG